MRQERVRSRCWRRSASGGGRCAHPWKEIEHSAGRAERGRETHSVRGRRIGSKGGGRDGGKG